MPDFERRKQQRHPRRIDVIVKTIETSFSAIAIDFSGDGIRIQSPKSIPHGTKIQITLKRKVKIEFQGTVVWVLHSLLDMQNIYEIGVKNNLIVLEHHKFKTHSARDEVVEKILSKITTG